MLIFCQVMLRRFYARFTNKLQAFQKVPVLSKLDPKSQEELSYAG
jgi:hypothetical protein